MIEIRCLSKGRTAAPPTKYMPNSLPLNTHILKNRRRKKTNKHNNSFSCLCYFCYYRRHILPLPPFGVSFLETIRMCKDINHTHFAFFRTLPLPPFFFLLHYSVGTISDFTFQSQSQILQNPPIFLQ
ncbi:hypothetical protein, unlikely [Trypanosoma brucei gambiense DAL972]|uniref:Uncharacterized protein n=1 Tax=Trypanosoma brucei gambiense (strain MHOM/CI/86/DAL972) TaxID=679716 RepID=C9ZN30_TRYB9|nr:hypothetical protein, unlikely [Trypanosoma brucei gambiense DAL972]CBH10684.1 hypothetical protein, unlikely [Trypanosoma brucei gambiense DAL972]|eukprot:XP_011772972.1 hypothetical protein, unlikely [Trypanosoma brucei gambiense DAL972]